MSVRFILLFFFFFGNVSILFYSNIRTRNMQKRKKKLKINENEVSPSLIIHLCRVETSRCRVSIVVVGNRAAA